ncbi:hypothetical protein FNV43_RR26642 [Rhamnella rubrinervis]|uniref:Uncharacterized protein n=1 Tax=Rhamnella rubrinervis TaxID=2594499 RepID=A0A8K0GNY9_9ROSA|nr:hypothetical protein FNV43_RR26642 [Rhamnella rubrinervis]
MVEQGRCASFYEHNVKGLPIRTKNCDCRQLNPILHHHPGSKDSTIPSPINLDMTLTDASHEIDPQPVVTIGPSLAETEMPFNSHLIIEDITEAEGNPEFLLQLHTAKEVVGPHVFADLENFFNQNPPPQILNTQLVQSDKKKINAAKKVLLEMVGTGFDIVTEEEARNNYRKSIHTDAGFFPDSMKSSISKFLHSLDEELATFNKFRENIFDAASHRSSMISLQTSIQSKASEYTTTSTKLTAQEHLVKELRAKLAEAEDVCGNLRHSLKHTIDEAEKEKKRYIDLLNASKNRDEARTQAEAAITAHHASWGAMNNSIIAYFTV